MVFVSLKKIKEEEDLYVHVMSGEDT